MFCLYASHTDWRYFCDLICVTPRYHQNISADICSTLFWHRSFWCPAIQLQNYTEVSGLMPEYPEVLRTFVTSGIAAAITGVTYTISVIRMPISFYLVGWGLVFALTASSRMMYRLLRRARIKAEGVKANPVRQNIMIIGAGAAGLMLLKEYRTSYYLTDKVKIFIDDNEEKWNKYLDGVRIAGGRDQILAQCR